ncbi:DUF6151 family protein [Phaeobacter sp.]|uniref:DUF6151 family protein n=1 Tax=Phaeobacter sp. TaxID=1902409 RepID=UPI0025E8B8EB|nr:DUF6151 family protein [Phaeobacter sp.]
MANALEFSCNCGDLCGHLTPEAQRAGTRIECFCPDCRAAELHFQQPDPAPGAVDLFQTTPDGIHITKGAENLRLMRLSPRGLMRWYAGCCGAPIANTLAKPGLPFVGLRSDRFADPAALGKIKARAFVPQPGKAPRTYGGARMALALLSRMITVRMSGRWRETPFFDVETGTPVAEAEVISKEARAALLP